MQASRISRLTRPKGEVFSRNPPLWVGLNEKQLSEHQINTPLHYRLTVCRASSSKRHAQLQERQLGFRTEPPAAFNLMLPSAADTDCCRHCDQCKNPDITSMPTALYDGKLCRSNWEVLSLRD